MKSPSRKAKTGLKYSARDNSKGILARAKNNCSHSICTADDVVDMRFTAGLYGFRCKTYEIIPE